MRQLRLAAICFATLATVACSNEPERSNAQPREDARSDAATSAGDSGSGTPDMGSVGDEGVTPTPDDGVGDSGGDQGGAEDMASVDMTTADVAVDTGPPPACDFRAVNDIVVIEAENLPLNEDWVVATTEAGYSGAGYIEWVGQSYNNDPTHGVMQVAVQIDTPGRYQLQIHTRIGEGTNATEHNDAWFRFRNADDYYGLKGQPGAEIRRYPKPKCDDDTLMNPIRALADVDTADCVRGSTRDGWLKVYSSGATDWRWSARTSDSDASDVMAEFGSAGVYTMELAARADHHLIDRIVLHIESATDNDVRNLSLAETTCP